MLRFYSPTPCLELNNRIRGRENWHLQSKKHSNCHSQRRTRGPQRGEDSGAITSALLGDGKLSVVERPLTCEEAAAFVRVHPRTVRRMARAGKVPGHFRFGRWYFYASELDCWMRMELHSARHP